MIHTRKFLELICEDLVDTSFNEKKLEMQKIMYVIFYTESISSI